MYVEPRKERRGNSADLERHRNQLVNNWVTSLEYNSHHWQFESFTVTSVNLFHKIRTLLSPFHSNDVPKVPKASTDAGPHSVRAAPKIRIIFSNALR